MKTIFKYFKSLIYKKMIYGKSKRLKIENSLDLDYTKNEKSKILTLVFYYT